MENYVVITSVINPPNTPLSYVNYRSLFSKEDRYKQTLLSIQNTRKYLKNSYICLIECSSDIEEYEDNIKKIVDKYINLYNNAKSREIILCPYKGYGESVQILEGISMIPDNIAFKNFFKLSGRYYLTEDFNIDLFNNDKIVVNVVDSVNNINTVLYKIPLYILNDYEYFLKNIAPKYYMEGMGAEKVFPLFLKKFENDVKYNFHFGIEGNVSVSGELWKGSHYPRKKIYIVNNSMHHMIYKSIHLCISTLNWIIVNSIEEADVIYSPSEPLEIKYPEKKYIFGPQFSIVPDENSRNLSNKYGNALYIQPSNWTRDVWKNDYNFNSVPIVAYGYCIDTDKYNSNNIERNQVFIYIKAREDSDISYIINIMNSKGIQYNVIEYGRYNEEEYIDTLRKSKYGIWIGCHESQGFALECALSMGVPLLVWNVQRMSQQTYCPPYYYNIKTAATSIPYWDDRCGEFFYEREQFDSTYEKFLNKLSDYKPREFVLDNLSPVVRSLALIQLVS